VVQPEPEPTSSTEAPAGTSSSSSITVTVEGWEQVASKPMGSARSWAAYPRWPCGR